MRRHIGYVIQGNGLFPHRTVAENIATVPKLLGWDARDRARVDELLDGLRLDPRDYAGKRPMNCPAASSRGLGSRARSPPSRRCC